ncbi:MAG: hypothetical protein C0427_08450 [Rhodobacter sp.]|nr:hypothetical protein [Rhodobacter sp.]
MWRQGMRGLGQGLAVMVRRAMMRLVARRDILGLSVAGGRSSNLADMQVLVRLRGRAALDGGALLALGRSLRRMLRLQPGAGLPLLVIRLAEEAPDEAGADPCGVTGTWLSSRSQGRERSSAASQVATRIMDLCGLSVASKRIRRRSRSPPSP